MSGDDTAPPGRLSRRPWVRRSATAVPVLLSLLDAALVDDLSRSLQTGASILATLALLARNRWPVPVLLLTLPGTFLSYIWIAPMTAVYTVAARRRSTPVTVACASLFALVEFFHWPLADSWPISLDRSTALYAIECLMLAGGPAAMGLLVRTREELAVRLDELTRGHRREERLLADRVLATERARLAREMHDVVSHQVSLISIQAGALQVSAADPATGDSARTIRELAVRTLDELRHMVGVLRAAGGSTQDLTPQPTLADLPRLIDGSGLDARSELEWGGRTWPEAVERAAYRTVQEALTNVRKHAPGAEVAVRVRAEGDLLRVEVRNGPPDGAADSPKLPGGGHGLVGLRERAQLLGGTLLVGPLPGGGFLVRAALPMLAETARP
ncbi:sensor histidine kinase [Peterkaempfera bronchialis]|uniref:histidine kinase n=1 Tax=Peterkaempfera bronchialis TaxID=2126346 RepID=A0A345SY44_9ACTN|nr:histidine kinase [Peterkaempfera bronchialis]AXI78649.1 two-component sensor histidine kinase [Peterkaempfera bronchialis]